MGGKALVARPLVEELFFFAASLSLLRFSAIFEVFLVYSLFSRINSFCLFLGAMKLEDIDDIVVKEEFFHFIEIKDDLIEIKEEIHNEPDCLGNELGRFLFIN